MSSVGTSNGPSQGPVYNEVTAFVCSDDVVKFVFNYTDPETNRVRFTDKEPDTLIVNIALADILTMARLSSISADGIQTALSRERIRKQIAEEGL